MLALHSTRLKTIEMIHTYWQSTQYKDEIGQFPKQR